MVRRWNEGDFFIWHTSPNYLFSTVLVQVQVLKVDVPSYRKEFLFVFNRPLRRYSIGHQRVHDVCIPGNAEIANNCSSGKRVLNRCGSCSAILKVSLGKWFATTLSTPFLTLFMISSSWSKGIHQINHGLASFLDNKYFNVAWSVKQTMGEPMRMDLNLSKANTTVNNSFSIIE